MAVSGKTAAPHEIPYFLGSDSPPDMGDVTQAMAERLHERLGAVDLSQLVASEEDDGKLLIVNSGAAAYKAMSGDVTIDEDGVATIGAGKVTEGKLGSNSVVTGKIKNGAVTDVKMASPNNAAYKTIHEVTTRIFPATTTGVSLLFALDGGYWHSGAALTGSQTPPLVPLDPADAEVVGLTQELRLRVACINAGAAQTKNFGVSLRQVTSTEYKEAHIAITASATELGKVSVESPGANSRSQKAGADFSIPEAGLYVVAVVLSGAVTAASEVVLSVQVQSHNV